MNIVLDRYIQLVNDENISKYFCVDIGAGDGIDMSNTFNLVKGDTKDLWSEQIIQNLQKWQLNL
ncbi:MAG: hypothetical protein CM15mP11_09850 [Gammaproteobacteria bacterium]|nr:MAG: hypothetical protein CM15mP11_09850 [Gammaproteobacteria bacterium]